MRKDRVRQIVGGLIAYDQVCLLTFLATHVDPKPKVSFKPAHPVVFAALPNPERVAKLTETLADPEVETPAADLNLYDLLGQRFSMVPSAEAAARMAAASLAGRRPRVRLAKRFYCDPGAYSIYGGSPAVLKRKGIYVASIFSFELQAAFRKLGVKG